MSFGRNFTCTDMTVTTGNLKAHPETMNVHWGVLSGNCEQSIHS